MIRRLSLLFTSLLLVEPAQARFVWEEHYEIESIVLPAGVDPQIGGLDVDDDGRLVACFHRGEVMIYEEESQTWSLFATGLHEPLGLYAEDDGSVFVVQRGELTRLVDTDGDGSADLYETVCSDWGMAGNYHEFAFGLVKDSKGNFYVGLGTASNGAGVRKEVRGEWNDAGGLTHDRFHTEDRKEWAEKKDAVPRMYARVPYRGCIVQITPGSRTAKVYATGFRTPNGLYIDGNDQLWMSDNQGDWVGASKLHKVRPGKFHGHAASLLWGENPPDVTPAFLPAEELDARRVKAAALLPSGDCGNSITQIQPLLSSLAPVRKDNDLLLIGEMNRARLPLYFPDEVKGQPQGAVTHFYDSSGLGTGNNRLVYTDDGKSLYVGKTHLSWPGSEGLKKITYKGNPYLMVQSFKLHPKGFEVTFNGRVQNTKRIQDYRIESYEILYHAQYGSPKEDLRDETVVHVDNKGGRIIVELKEAPQAGRVYDLTFPSLLRSEELGSLSSHRYWYTAHKVH